MKAFDNATQPQKPQRESVRACLCFSFQILLITRVIIDRIGLHSVLIALVIIIIIIIIIMIIIILIIITIIIIIIIILILILIIIIIIIINNWKLLQVK